MPIHIRVLLVIHVLFFLLSVFVAMVSTSSEALVNFAIAAWFGIVALGIWAQLKIIRYAIWVNGLLGVAFAIFQAIFIYVLLTAPSEQEYSLLEPVLALLFQLAFGIYTVFAVRSDDARRYFQSR